MTMATIRCGACRGSLLLLLLAVGCGLDGKPEAGGGAAPGRPPTEDAQPASLVMLSLPPGQEDLAPTLEAWLAQGRSRVEAYFGAPFPESVVVQVHADRAAFTASFPPEWGLGETACWMVAYGVADRLSLLSPRAWRTQACEHDPDDEAHVRALLAHELVHVYHGQHNPTRDFTGIEEQVGWFVEGLAVLVSGQLDEARWDVACRALADGQAPERLTEAWSGPARYAVCGTLAALLEQRCGRDGLRRLLGATTLDGILAEAGADEAGLLDAWRRMLVARDT